MTSDTLRTMIIDDEPLARKKIRRVLASDRRVTVVGESGDGAEAVGLIRSSAPDLVFLDVQMPTMDGFAVIREIGPENMPPVVLVTAFEEHAITAFRVNAVDYLLKPVDPLLVRSAVDRALRRHATTPVPQLSRLPASGSSDETGRPAYIDRFMVRAKGRMFFVKIADVDWIEAADNYLRVHAGGATHLIRETISVIEGRLDQTQFIRIHRSAIINIDSVRELQPWTSGEMIVIMKDGAKVKLSRGYRDNLIRRIHSDKSPEK